MGLCVQDNGENLCGEKQNHNWKAERCCQGLHNSRKDKNFRTRQAWSQSWAFPPAYAVRPEVNVSASISVCCFMYVMGIWLTSHAYSEN